MSQQEKPRKSTFRRYVATGMAAITVSAILYGYLTGLFTSASEGLAGGVIAGFAVKYLWEESG